MIYSLSTSVPSPTIYPLDNDAKVYSGKVKITFDSYPFIKTYYSLDGSDPKDGHIYEGAIIITKTTTVSAKNKFLFGGWSNIEQSTYRFENMQITYSGYMNALIEDGNRAIDGFVELLFKIFLVVVVLIALFRSLINELGVIIHETTWYGLFLMGYCW
ncbi:MAG: chitobiase/beta-hexosaminidase C-terminal domain-containing protein [Bacilli bacterium]|nr:chitobiase/beta-hexosaminidase C-terminal domain-containing protein [Bacilli bacterium]